MDEWILVGSIIAFLFIYGLLSQLYEYIKDTPNRKKNNIANEVYVEYGLEKKIRQAKQILSQQKFSSKSSQKTGPDSSEDLSSSFIDDFERAYKV